MKPDRATRPGGGDRRERLGAIVAGVLAAVAEEAGAACLVVLDDGSPEAALASEWAALALGDGRVVRMDDALLGGLEPALRELLVAMSGEEGPGDGPSAAHVREEARRFAARLVATRRRGLVLNPVNKTALILGLEPVSESILPLGDLWATQVRELTGSWNAPGQVVALAEACGGIDRLDRALRRWCDERTALHVATEDLPPAIAARLRLAIRLARFARGRTGLVPKLGPRTPGVDLFA